MVLRNISPLAEKLAAYNHLAHSMLQGQAGGYTELEESWLEYYLSRESQGETNSATFAKYQKPGMKYKFCLNKYYGGGIKNKDLDRFLNISAELKTRLESMIESGELLCKLPIESILKIYNGYRQIRDERNISSHAKKQKSQLGFKGIKDTIQKSLDAIKGAINKE